MSTTSPSTLHTTMHRGPRYRHRKCTASLKLEIDKHLTATALLRQQLNRFEPILSVPPEIMVNIFSFVRDASPHPLHWIKVTHICTYWRKVAIHAPGLWCRRRSRTSIGRWKCWARSKKVKITLESDSNEYYTGQYEGYEEAFKHAVRIRNMSLTSQRQRRNTNRELFVTSPCRHHT